MIKVTENGSRRSEMEDIEMKKREFRKVLAVLLTLSLLCGSIAALAEDPVKVGDVKTVTITFTNIGKKPLILDDVISSCDCTTVDWSKQPIMPGKKGTIKATYTAKHTGLISKRLTVLSNANTDRVILQLKGEVK